MERVRHLLNVFSAIAITLFLVSCAGSIVQDPMKEAAAVIANQLGLPETSQSTDDRFIIFFATELKSGDVVSEPDPFKNSVKSIPEQAKWLFVLDRQPLAKFAHDVTYIYVDEDFQIVGQQEAEWMPFVNDSPILLGNIYNPSFSQIKWSNFEWVISGSYPVTELVATVPNNCAIVVNGNDPTRYADVGISTDKEHMESFFSRFYSQNAVRALEYPNNTRQELQQAIDELVQGGAVWITIYISSHGSTDSLVMGTTRMTPTDLRGMISNHPQTNFYVIIDACHSGSFIDDLYYDGLTNLHAIITATDANHNSYGDCDGKKDPNPQDTGGEWTSGFYETLIACTSTPLMWNIVQSMVTLYHVQIEQALYKICYDEAYKLDCARIAGLSFPQYCGWSPTKQLYSKPFESKIFCNRLVFSE